MRIVAQATDILKKKAASGKVTKEMVQTWLVNNIKWGLHHVPDATTVDNHMRNWEKIQKNPRALELIEAAKSRWGRENLLDWPTKLAKIVTKSEPGSLCFLIESLFSQMWRTNQKDPYGVKELTSVLPTILWARTYFKEFLHKFPELLKTSSDHPEGNGNANAQCRLFLHHPYDFFVATEGPERDSTLLQSLPQEADRLFMKHALEVAQGLYAPEIKGALSGTGAEKYGIDKFLGAARVQKRFGDQFKIAYDTLIGKKSEPDGEAQAAALAALNQEGGGAPKSAGQQQDGQESKIETEPQKKVAVSNYRTHCETYCQGELDARVITVLAEGTHVEIGASVTKTRLYQNLTDSVPLMAFYDVKNAKLCNIFEGEGFS